MARYTRTQQILRAQSAEAISNPELMLEFTRADLNSRANDIANAQAAEELGNPGAAKFWRDCARRTERRIRKRADAIILARRHALELEDAAAEASR
jgi:hypothetical protein